MKFCRNCGTSLEDDAKFCTSCGFPIEVNTNAQSQQATTQAQPQILSQSYQSQHPQYQSTYVSSDIQNDPLSVGEWMLTILVLAIPIVNLVMLFVWAFGSGNISRKNYCKASLIFAAIFIVIYILLLAIVGTSIFSASRYYYY